MARGGDQNARLETFTINVDGQKATARDGDTVLQVLNAAGIELPQVCYHSSLGPIETCDTCIVEAGGALVRACSLPAKPGLAVRTRAVAADMARKEAMDRILGNHELYCTVCDNNNGNCTIHNTASMMKVEHQTYPFQKKPYEADHSNPFYRYDPDQCILCGRCVEACQNLQVSEVLSIDWSREVPRVIWDNDAAINDSSCVSCGHCVTVCPCNALMEKSMLGEAGIMTGIEPATKEKMIDFVKQTEPGYGPVFAVSELESTLRESLIKKTKTVCTYCGVGCSFNVWTKGRKILKVEPHIEAPVNGISTCVKGKFGWDFVNSQDRLLHPLIRRGDRFETASWDEALDYVSSKLREIRSEYGPDSIGCISSSKCTNEENYLMQKFARAVMGTNNIDNCSRYCQAPATFGLRRTMGYGGDTGSISDIAQADLVLIVGANPAESHPVLSTRVRRAHKKNGQKLIVSDLRKNDMAERADLFIHPNPGTDLVWLSAVTKYIVDQGWHDAEFLNSRVNGLEVYLPSLEQYTLEHASAVTGISQEQLIQVATMIRDSKRFCILWAMGVTQHVGGSETSTAICNLLLITGQVGRPGTGAYPLRGHNNVQGAGDFGCAPDVFPGYEPVADEAIRSKYEKHWNVKLPTERGLNNHQMVDAIHEGNLRAMYLMGEDMTLVDANANYVQSAFEKLEFLVVQDVFFSKTAQYADVILPASPSLEKEGTFTNTERRIQRLYQVLDPLGESRPDWRILLEMARRMGATWDYQHPSEIMAEAAAAAGMFAGVYYDRLEGYQSLQWPVRPDGSDSPLLYMNDFPLEGGKARLIPTQFFEPVCWTDPSEYDLHLNNGRMLEHFHEGNLTYRVSGIAKKVPTTYVEISPELAYERGVENGTLVRIVSQYGAVRVRAVVTDRVQGKELYLPMNSSKHEEAVNYLTGNATDRNTNTPAYKEVSVRMEVLNEKGPSPMKQGNYRLGHKNPLPGVQVEQKWARKDYQPIVKTPVTDEDSTKGAD
ncbi:formate dehydrogenase subunit alpha [Alicyclobacillus ferrooxydans]|uniref:Oxidoreductase n=1 Tax=Alicyclobacillus ferrooxydans TaxID=471514 RepID=A0A0P9CJF5_9BACL|nr:formate dehydrogenase subunit alpha [Alicyclobacillus ferrooxydans]KPV45788.1 oxidoreductase [Alicyclobacillus ferrooxydans]